MEVESVGIRELRQNASRVIDAAAKGTTFQVTNHGAATGVVIVKEQDPSPEQPSRAAPERTGASPEQIMASGLYDSPRPDHYEAEMLRLVESGRDQSGRVGGP
ncbi:type II toxin-antitoxin system Phd/YefM family antitoxin [Mycolicibacter algericus]|uniref:Antitoxin n=2 Tax=Mycolicibacter algericus TaxID=1288388 RepID=A0A7I9YEK8_MYCAL|nr:type II toxin-antitoxin system Phd/YefM family antitoxin [Mycolicibacter algericus]OQZ96312.1 hypothetical protein BST10_12420 [Mycolicibacter algericus DSM 45454]GFG87108.1 hypothetical protein MALGJ_37840 [Mycolicibacter algericus]